MVAARDSQTKEIVVTATIRNEGSGAVDTNFVLNSAKLNNRPTTTSLPLSVNAVAATETATLVLRFSAMAATSNTRAVLSGSGTSHGAVFSGAVQVTVP